MDQPPLQKHPNHRSRSNTAMSGKSRQRPLSRASTTSVHSGLTQPILEQHPVDPSMQYQKSWYGQNPHAQQQFGGMGHQMTPEDVIMQSASQLQNPQDYEIDPALSSQQHHQIAYGHQEGQYKLDQGRQSVPGQGYGANYGEGDSQMIEGGRSDEQDDVDSVAGAGAAKKPNKSGAANELEMRQLFNANKHRSLPEVAAELHGNERGPHSERQRQVFAMLWIDSVCDNGKGSVPRSRVYQNYVTRCGTERVTVLNPASFGKLVRVLFPGLKTRRLGVRGESKYHYVNFSLKEEQPDLAASQSKIEPAAPSFTDSNGFVTSFNHSMQSQPQYPVDRAVFPTPVVTQAPEPRRQRFEGFIRPHSLYKQSELQDISQLEATNAKMPQFLKIAPLTETIPHDLQPITLPRIEQYLPVGTDPDAASTLTALYRSHCTSLVDALRFCKEKTFLHLYTSFHGTLTMPVQKLFANPAIAPWIEECDYILYQRMLRVVRPLTLQVAPKPVCDTLRNISGRLVSHIQHSFQGHPAHVINAKVAPATIFAGLLDRELRVNLTAHAAANMLSNPANRDQMYEEFITMVRTRKIAECVPTRGMDDVVNLLLTELRGLLDPVGVSWDVECLTPYGQMAIKTGRQQQAALNSESSTQNVLDRWVNFLETLPEKFPYATDAEIVWCVQSIGTAVMRDITIQQGKSFGAWWVTKCWIDEMISFLAEQGGFMEHQTLKAARAQSQPPRVVASQVEPQHGSRYSSGSDEFLRGGNMSGAVTVSGPMDASNQAAMSNTGHDDSGIGIRTPDDDFAMGKYDFDRNETGQSQIAAGFNPTATQNSVV